MKLARQHSDKPMISIVPMIDVLLILLVFFMVTSTYLNLDMIPFVERSNDPPATGANAEAGTTLLLRLASDGQVHQGGQVLSGAALTELMTQRLADNPLLSVVLLPSPRARTQDLVTVMDILTGAGATRLRLMQLEARE